MTSNPSQSHARPLLLSPPFTPQPYPLLHPARKVQPRQVRVPRRSNQTPPPPKPLTPAASPPFTLPHHHRRYDHAKYEYYAPVNTLFGIQMLLFAWAELRRLQDIRKPGSVNQDPIFTQYR